MLAGDDFGYLESVILTLQHGRPVLSDWLNPFSIGMTVPAAVLTHFVENIWHGSMLVLGLIGLMGLVALWDLLRTLAVPLYAAVCALLAWTFFPIWLGKWTRFESVIPALSLMLGSAALLLHALRPANIKSARGAWLLFAASLCATWAISIRQSHLVIVLVGGLGILVSPGVTRRSFRLFLWLTAPLAAFALLQINFSTSLAQQAESVYTLQQLTPAAPLPTADPARRTLHAGTARLGFRDQSWMLFRTAEPPGEKSTAAIEHRYLPLTTEEWRAVVTAWPAPK